MNAFSDTLEKTAPPKGAVALFWLEQSHFIIRTHGGSLIHVDPFLSRIVKPELHIHPEPLLPPDKTRADYAFLTHDHRDHTDPHTIGPMAQANPACVFVGPPESVDRCLRECGVPKNRVEAIREGERKEFPLPREEENPPSFSVRAVFAQDTSDPPSTTHQGYVFDFGGIRIYHTGDTRKDPDAYADHLGAVTNLRPDAMLVAINEGANNPGPAGAVRLMEIVQPRIVVPCHYDCFKSNTIDPARFVEAAPAALAERIRVLPRGGCLIVEKP